MEEEKKNSKTIQGSQNKITAKICRNRKIFQHSLLELMKVIFLWSFCCRRIGFCLFFLFFPVNIYVTWNLADKV